MTGKPNDKGYTMLEVKSSVLESEHLRITTIDNRLSLILGEKPNRRGTIRAMLRYALAHEKEFLAWAQVGHGQETEE